MILAQQSPRDALTFSLVARLRGLKQRKLNDRVFHLFCLCPVGLAVKLNFNISKVAHWLDCTRKIPCSHLRSFP